MDITHEVISNKQTSTPPVNQKKEGIRAFSLEKLEDACAKYGVTLEEAIARFLALDETQAEAAKANVVHMRRDQAKLAKDLADKYEPDKKADQNIKGELDVNVTSIERRIIDP